jgi:tRNA threonylcarbamoyladenosine biosynthesis protein TsaB
MTENKTALLAMDSSGSVLSLALEAAGGIWLFEADVGLRHSELIMDCTNMLLKKADLTPAELGGLLCMGGPGSFTGLRIAFAAVKGLSLALGIPFAAIPSLDCMALPHAYFPGLVIPVIDAKKNAFFCAFYLYGERLCPDMDAEPELIARAISEANTKTENILLTGPDAEKLYPLLKEILAAKNMQNRILHFCEKPKQGYSREILAIAKNGKIFDNYTMDWLSGPQYIRKSDAELTSACKLNAL